VVRFQAAYVSPAEIREVAAALRREGLPRRGAGAEIRRCAELGP